MDGSRRRHVLALVVLSVLLSASALPAAGTPSEAWGVQSVDPDQVYLQVDLQPDGDAAWTVTYRVRLETQNETEAFESLKRDIEQNESQYLDDFSRRIRDTVSAAQNATNRPMAATNFSVNAEIRQLPQTYGVITYRFTWQQFATTPGDRIVAGDALAGFFLDSETTLAIQWPEQYGLVSVAPEPHERGSEKVVWHGQLDFGDGEPRVVVSKAAATTTTTGTTDGPTRTTTVPPGEAAGGLPGAFVGLALLLAAVAVGAFVYFRRERGAGGATPSQPPASGPGTEEPSPGAGAGGAEAATPQPEAEQRTDAEAEPEPEPEAAAPPEELLSNEERVKRFLRERGGRAKQQELVEGLGWTDAKTSQVLSGMESDDEIEKFRIGRENVVKLPDEDADTETSADADADADDAP